MSRVLKHFDILTQNGIKVIPLHPFSKIPICYNWTKNWNLDGSRELLERNPNSNIGILLGEVIDVEGDSDEANEKINSLIGDYQHPAYSSTKSIHHLFHNPDPNLTIVKHKKIEFRANKHQSVLPPSILENGVEYKWLNNLTFPLPEMPDKLLDFFNKIKNPIRPELKPGHMKLPCFICQKKQYIHQKRFNLEIIAFKKLGLRWMCQKCRSVDLRPICRDIRKNSIYYAA